MVGGRQLQFDKQKALVQAMHVFWTKGFLGASLSDLTSAMGISKPSLYASFGNKEDLFVSATNHYIEAYASKSTVFLHQENKSLTERIQAYLFSLIELLCESTASRGCFIAVAANELIANSLPEKAAERIQYVSQYTEHYLRDFFTAEKQQGNLTAEVDINELSLLFLTHMHGSSAMARSGKSTQQMKAVSRLFIKNLNLSLNIN
ncbi:MAG: TetR family transcriptional regulator [Gammaproteobacteria bacterium]|nr:MAG: TetR family transcriptional regulator [Gammaproteobacteria bacterium]